MDCLDEYILEATMDVIELEHFDDLPMEWRPPPLLMTEEKSDEYQWLFKFGQEILEKHVKLDNGKANLSFKRIDPLALISSYVFTRYLSLKLIQNFFIDKNLTRMSEEAKEMDTQSLSIQLMFDNDLQKFVCSCGKQYKTLGFFKRHLVNIHNKVFRDNEDPKPDSSCESPTPDSSCESKTDKVANYRASFLKNALLLRDTYDAFSMCDGERIVRNAKFIFIVYDRQNLFLCIVICFIIHSLI